MSIDICSLTTDFYWAIFAGMEKKRCFACNRPLSPFPKMAVTRDGQHVYVGENCHKLIIKAGAEGYQPPLGGPKLYQDDTA